jgi:hypothetical protein
LKLPGWRQPIHPLTLEEQAMALLLHIQTHTAVATDTALKRPDRCGPEPVEVGAREVTDQDLRPNWDDVTENHPRFQSLGDGSTGAGEQIASSRAGVRGIKWAKRMATRKRRDLCEHRLLSTFAAVPGPTGIAFSSTGDLFVASIGGPGRVFRVTPGGATTTFASGLTVPVGLAFDANGTLFVADNGANAIHKVAPDGTVSPFASNVIAAFGLTFDPSGELFVANITTGTIQRVTPDGNASTYFVGLDRPRFILDVPEPGAVFSLAGLLAASRGSRRRVTRAQA